MRNFFIKKISIALFSVTFFSSAWTIATDKNLFSTWVDAQNEILDLTQCISYQEENLQNDKVYFCRLTFVAYEDTCNTTITFSLGANSVEPSTQKSGVFLVDLMSGTNFETCGQKRYGEFGQFTKSNDTLTLKSTSLAWADTDLKNEKFKGNAGRRTFIFH